MPGLLFFRSVGAPCGDDCDPIVELLGFDPTTREVLRGPVLFRRMQAALEDSSALARAFVEVTARGRGHLAQLPNDARWLDSQDAALVSLSEPHLEDGALVFWVLEGSMHPSLSRWRVDLSTGEHVETPAYAIARALRHAEQAGQGEEAEQADGSDP